MTWRLWKAKFGIWAGSNYRIDEYFVVTKGDALHEVRDCVNNNPEVGRVYSSLPREAIYLGDVLLPQGDLREVFGPPAVVVEVARETREGHAKETEQGKG